MPETLVTTNEFVAKFANVNGSGSASANRVFARSILRMGIPVSSRNIFPSNIQGLPTWYEVRVSERDYLGRRGGVDLMVQMNPETWDQDIASIEPGGYLFYDETKPLPAEKFRADINVLGIPITAIANEHWSEARQRQLLKNMIYVGGLAEVIGIDLDVLEALVREQFEGKDRLIEPNLQALRLGREYADANLHCPVGLQVRRADAVGDRIFIDGNHAAALGAVYGGATVAAWYPITPSTSLAEAFQAYCRRYRKDEEGGKRYAVIQAEDELASIGIVIGAGWNGARAFTATSGPGISLMSEFIGLAYFAEVPAVIFNVQRGGPSTGMPTRTQQADLLACAYASHGDTKQVLLFPEDPHECFELAAQAFDLADRLQTPIFVLSDLDIGMNEWLCRPFEWQPGQPLDRGKVMSFDDLEGGQEFGRYLDVDGDGIPFRTYPGTHPSRGAFFTRGTSKDRYARYTEAGAAYVDNMERLLTKFETAKTLVPESVVRTGAGASAAGIIYYGSTGAALPEALDALEAEGVHFDTLRVRAFPFDDRVDAFIADHERLFVIEQNRDGQLRMLLVNECGVDPAKLVPILHYDGTPITARFIIRAIADKLTALEVVPFRKAAS